MTDSARAAPTASRQLIWTLAALASFGPLSTDMYLPGLPSLTRDLHTSAAAANLTLTASVLGLGLGQLIAGPASDQLGRRRPLLVGLAGFALASALCAAAPSVWVLTAVRLVQGLCGGAGIVIARAIIRDLYGGTQAARMYATQMAITGVAPILAPLIGGGVLTVSSWRGVFLVLTATGVCLVALATRSVPETLPVAQRSGGGMRASVRMLGGLVSDRAFTPYCVAFACSFGAMFAYISGGSYVLENVYGISPQLFSAIFAGNSLGFMALSHLSARVVDRFGSMRLLRWGLVAVCAGALGVLAVTADRGAIWVLLIVLFCVVAANGLALSNGVAAAMASRPQALGSASALLGLAQFGLGAAIAPLVGLGGARDALPMGIVMAACGAVALGASLTFSDRRPAAV
ncbi:MAG TPA: multidrug effflux MFS transporter [Solirubrobacteraceae bacterium]|nr:multidrug effflux MFS transporter [Solirubrobacteraceae bacterium]